MVREAKPLTRIVPVPPMAPPAARRGRLVLEVQDPEAIAALGEQLSLANQLITPLPDDAPSPKSTRSRKTTTAKSTVSKAKQKNTVEASITVPLAAPERPDSERSDAKPLAPEQPENEVQMLARVQQLSATIAQLQSQLEHLHRPATPPPSPTINPAQRQRATAPHLHLPDWHEPELRSHYTLADSARAYAALEALHSHRKLQTAEGPEIDQAYAVADDLRSVADHRLRQSHAPIALPSPGRSRRQRRTPATGPIAAPRPGSRVKRRTRWQWNRQACWRNLQHLGQSLLPVPVEPGAKVVDVVIWVAGAIALRLLLKGVIALIPLLALPLNLLMAIPAIVAAYLAFCVPHSRSDVIYRLLLVTLGLFLGSRV